jgi:hypothetical protein
VSKGPNILPWIADLQRAYTTPAPALKGAKVRTVSDRKRGARDKARGLAAWRAKKAGQRG